MAPLLSALGLMSIAPRAFFCFQSLIREGMRYERDDATLDTGPIDVQHTEDSATASPTPMPTHAPSVPRRLPQPRTEDPLDDYPSPYDIFGGGSPLSTPPSSRPQSPAGADLKRDIKQGRSGNRSKRRRKGEQREEHAVGVDAPRAPKKVAFDKPTPHAEEMSPRRAAPHPHAPTEAAHTKNSKQRRDAKRSRQRRTDGRREERAEDVDSSRTPKSVIFEKHILRSEEMSAAYTVQDIPSASTGYIALRDDGDRVHSLDELLALGFELVKWDGRESRPIVDSNGVVVAVLAGMPNDPSWQQVHEDAFQLLEDSHPACSFTEECTNHRRGQFAVLNAGISFGGGQQVPGNLSHDEARKEVLQGLFDSNCFIRLAGFASGAFAAWMPKIHRHYEKYFNSLLSRHKDLRRNFSNSVWGAVAFNFGPQTVTAKHRDFANLPFGICGITALGKYDYVKGGHIVLWELGLVIEFPAGSTVLIPSAAISHSNTPISPHERRASFTQYSAGGLFRWVDQGFKTQEKFFASLSKAKRKKIPALNEARVAYGLSLFSTLDELRAKK